VPVPLYCSSHKLISFSRYRNLKQIAQKSLDL
jgi:hypothetical protein